MDIAQAFRRIGQQMKGLTAGFDEQYAQFPLVKKLYERNGFTISGGGMFPEKYDVKKDGVQVAYLRLRHGEFTVDMPDACAKEVLCEWPDGDGSFNANERFVYMTKALRKIQSELNNPPCQPVAD